MTLSPDLLSRIQARIADPAGHNDHSTARMGAAPTPIADIRAKFDANAPGSGDGFDLMRDQMAAWGFTLDSMNFKDMGGGHLSAFSDDPNADLPPPPGDARLDEAEATMRLEIPEGIRQLYRFGDGGFGPGLGLFSLAALVGGYQDICRRGPDWTGRVEWPRHLLPVFNAVPLPSAHGFDMPGIVSVDTIDGRLVTFNEDWVEDGISVDAAWSDVASNLTEFLESWLSPAPR